MYMLQRKFLSALQESLFEMRNAIDANKPLLEKLKQTFLDVCLREGVGQLMTCL